MRSPTLQMMTISGHAPAAAMMRKDLNLTVQTKKRNKYDITEKEGEQYGKIDRDFFCRCG